MRTVDRDLKAAFWRPEHFVTDAQKQLARDVAEIEGKVEALREQGAKGQDISEYADEAVYQATVRHWEANQQARQAAEAELAKLGQQWKRQNDDPTRGLLERQRAEARFKLASDDELEREAQSYMTAEGEALIQSPDRLEALALALMGREGTKETGAALRDRMRENVYTEPWRYTPEGDALVGAIQAHSAEYGKTLVSTDGQSLVELELGDIINTEGTE